MVVHWDTKLPLGLTGRSRVDRIAVLVSFDGTAKLLGTPIVESSSGENCAKAVFDLLSQYGILDHVKAMSFDTTSSNTGNKTGACLRLQENYGLDLLRLPCRHHIFEVILKAVFECKLGRSSAPEVPVFERFASEWKTIRQEPFTTGIRDDVVKSKIPENVRRNMIEFCRQQLEEYQPRADYRQLLELVIIFLGGDPDNELKIRPPGVTCHARFMSKALYVFLSSTLD